MKKCKVWTHREGFLVKMPGTPKAVKMGEHLSGLGQKENHKKSTVQCLRCPKIPEYPDVLYSNLKMKHTVSFCLFTRTAAALKLMVILHHVLACRGRDDLIIVVFMDHWSAWPLFLLLNYGKFILFIEGVASKSNKTVSSPCSESLHHSEAAAMSFSSNVLVRDMKQV